ncbi:hypothetical protein DFH06DRAFT_507774 [Mycena polygramma]|nr:hypothetical protein DFH06DRAFT_507774 [Mycena polygramma]
MLAVRCSAVSPPPAFGPAYPLIPASRTPASGTIGALPSASVLWRAAAAGRVRNTPRRRAAPAPAVAAVVVDTEPDVDMEVAVDAFDTFDGCDACEGVGESRPQRKKLRPGRFPLPLGSGGGDGAGGRAVTVSDPRRGLSAEPCTGTRASTDRDFALPLPLLSLSFSFLSLSVRLSSASSARVRSSRALPLSSRERRLARAWTPTVGSLRTAPTPVASFRLLSRSRPLVRPPAPAPAPAPLFELPLAPSLSLRSLLCARANKLLNRFPIVRGMRVHLYRGSRMALASSSAETTMRGVVAAFHSLRRWMSERSQGEAWEVNEYQRGYEEEDRGKKRC